MNIRWTGDKCILCLSDDSLSKEHLILEALGGKLTSRFLCASCNSTLGRELEAKAKSDPSILMAAANLRDKLPKLSASLIDGHAHISYSENGPASGYIKNEEFRVKSKRLGDGSLIQPTNIARKTLMRLLEKQGYNKAISSKAVSSFEDAPENVRVEIAPGLEAVKWRIDRLEMDMSQTHFMDPLIPVKTAYEFISLLVGQAICADIPHLSEIRRIFKNRQIDPTVLAVERLYSDEYKPFHGICFEGNDPYARVQVRLFGWLAFRVNFLHLSIDAPKCAYTHRLDTGVEHFDVLN